MSMDRTLSVSFVMPMYNERDNIAEAIERIKSIAGEIAHDHEIIVVDDGSTDGCIDVVKGLADIDHSIRPFRLEENTKFGGAFAMGFKKADMDVIVYMDSDMPVSLEHIKRSFPLIRDADIVTGYSEVKKGDTILRKVISGVYNLMVQTLFGLHIRDINSGYKVVKRSLINDLEFISRSPFIDVELFLQAKKKKAKVEQYPLVFDSRTAGKSYIARPQVILATFRDMMKVKLHEISDR